MKKTLHQIYSFRETYRILLFLVLIFFSININIIELNANDEWEVEILDNPSPGFLHLSYRNESFYSLIDNYGNYPFPINGNEIIAPTKFFENKLWISLGLSCFYLYNEDYQLVDSIPFHPDYIADFHDILLLKNGHYLMIALEERTMDLSQVVEGGKTNASVRGNVLIETDVKGNIYWLWKALDHYEITDYPIIEDLKNQTIDFTHTNSLFEDTDGNIIVSMRSLDEVSKINKNTNEFMWRIGGKLSKKNQFTFINDSYNDFFGFSHQHSISILPNGNLLLFDNGNLKPNPYSRAVEYKLDLVAKTATKVWEYRPTPDIYLSSMGSVFQLANGNKLINFSTLANTDNETIVVEIKPDNSYAYKLKSKSSEKLIFLYSQRYITKMDAVMKNIASTGNYVYNDEKYTTGIELQIDEISGSGLTWFEKYNYAPTNAEYEDSSFYSILPNRWVFGKNNISNLTGKIKINTNQIDGIEAPDKLKIYYRNKETQGKFKPVTTEYNPNTKILSAEFMNFGEFVLVDTKLAKPDLIYPMNNQTGISISNSMKWSKLSAATHYGVQLSKKSNMTELVIDTTVSENSLNFVNLETNQNYFWRVRGLNSHDTSDWSEIYLFTTSNHNLTAPQLISPLNNSYGFDINQEITWTSIPNVNKYLLNISENSEFNIEESTLIEVNSNLFVASDLKYYTQYFWRVKSVRNSDTSDWSDTWNFYTRISIPELEFPQNNSFQENNEVQIAWKSVLGAENYQVQISLNPDFSELFINDDKLVQNQYIINSLEFDTKYYWRISALNNRDTSAWSDVWSFRTLLYPPELDYPSPEQKGVKSNSLFSWNYDYQSPLFDFQLSLDSEFRNIIIDTMNIPTGDFMIGQLDFNMNYFWRVRLRNNQQQSLWSDVRSFMSEMDKPSIIYPSANSIGVSVDTKFLWISQYNNFRIQIAKDLLFNDIIADEIISNSYEFKTKLDVSTTYYWRIKVETDDNFSDWTLVTKFITSPTTDIIEESANKVSIYPNPAEDYIIIQNSNSSKANIINLKLLDIMGSEIANYIVSDELQKIDISHLPPGVYFIISDKSIIRFIKN